MNENICKAALAELIGAICAHHPDEVKSNIATIWRVYLNLLDSKHSDTVVRSLLLGVSGVLKSFGNDLDIKEFPVFYKHLIESGEKSKCREVYLTILAKHADLFRELLANDPRTRMSLWHSYPASDTQGVNRQAILSVYNAIKQVFTENQCRYEEIVKTEICQFEKCNNTELKYTALRVLYALDTRNARVYCDMRALHALRHGRLTYEHCEMIQWCLEYNLENDVKLLKNVLVFYEHIPVKYQKELTVDIILRAPPSVRKMAVIFLTNETCQCYKENGNIEKYQQIWKSIFDTNSDDIKNKSNEVFLDFMEYLYQSLMENDEKNTEELSDKLSYLIIISSFIIPLGGEVVGERVCDVSRGVLRLLGGVGGLGGSGLRAARMLLRYAVDVYADIVKDISLEDCIDESTLYETCLGLVLTAARITDVTRVLQALKIILFRSDVEASILSRCINTLDNLMSTRKDELNADLLNKIIYRLEKIQHFVYKGKDGRCLRRELFMFLGKYGRNMNKDEDSLECIHLEKYMNLGIPFINEGIIIKLNLNQMHSLALRYEDTKMLQVLHELLYANLWDRVPHENVRRALCYSACVLRVRPQLRTRILTVCGDIALDVLLQFVDTESSEIRTSVCDILRQVSQHDKLAHTVLYNSTLCSKNKAAFLDISEIIVNIMKDDNALAQKYLPKLIQKIAKIDLKQSNIIYKNAMDLFKDKIELFRNVLTNFELELLNVILLKQNGNHVNKMADVRVIKNKMKLTLDFIKQIYGTDKDWYNMIENIIEKQNGDISRLFIILSFAKDVFDLDENLCHRLLEDNFVCEKLFTVEEDLDFLYLEGILNFFTQYADVLVKLHLELWPEFEKVSTFEQQHSLLLEVSYLSKKLPPESNPMQWIIRTITSDISTCDMKAKLIGLLPSGDSYKSTWRWYAGLLPARLSEAQGESGVLLAALLEALITADSSLLKTISQLIAGDTATGWWDDAIDACVVSLSKSNDISVYETLYSCCWEGLSLGVCCRLMVPLLRNSSAAVCEEFFSLKLKDLLSILKKKSSSSNQSFRYQMTVVNYIRALILLRVCIEMVPRLRIESPNSLLYSQMSNEVGTNVFYLTKTLSMLCVDLVKNRPVTCPDDADDSFKKICLLFYCENYNSLASAVWCRQPSDPKFYDLVFNKETWCRIIDPQMEYQLPLVESWQKHTMHQFAGVELEDSSCLLSSTSTTRTRTYLRTLSENPEEFDVGMLQDDQEYHQELCISENMLNQHPCAGILTMSVSRATSLSHMTWLNTIINTLTTDIHRNSKWLLAQAIYNCKEDLKGNASILRPALLAMLVQTSDQELNSLHIDIIDMIIYWGHKDDVKPDEKLNLNKVLEILIKTVVQNRRRKKIVYNLIQKMDQILDMFEHLEIQWTCLSECVYGNLINIICGHLLVVIQQ
ncbi:uncharacterized protein LOC106716394 [Papilio machaon]|uniref:uncharacterized protein LOC106716394 n=1 Tax=Papilio machaon TaxID=76193 RepID=UPI001E66388D|nr:uncharacterized protein LOC106716394 [Papilio machaon]